MPPAEHPEYCSTRSAVIALIGEQWRQNRWPFLLISLLAAVPLAWIWLDRLDPLTAASDDTYAVLLRAFMVMASMVFMGLAFTWKEGPHSLQFRVPPRLFALPVRTPTLAFTLFSAKLLSFFAFVGLFALAAGHIAFDNPIALWQPVAAFDLFRMQMLFTPTAAAMSAAAFLAIAWCPPALRILAILLVLPTLWWAPTSLSGTLFCLPLVLFISFGVALLGIHTDRRGSAGLVPTRLAGLPLLDFGRKRPFRSPVHAQAWYDYKSRTRRLPWIFLALFVLLLLPLVPTEDLADPADWFDKEHMFVIAPVAAALAALILGLLLSAMDYREHVSGLSSFTFTRPLKTRRLGAARLRAGAAAIAYTFGVIALMAGILLTCVLLGSQKERPRPEIMSILHPYVALPSLVLWIALCWSLIWLVPQLLLLVALPLEPALLQLYRLSQTHPNHEFRLILTYALLLLATWTTLVAILWRRRLITRRNVAAFFAAWASIVILFIGPMFYIVYDDPEGLEILAFTIIYALAPLLPFATVPLTLHWFRHR